MPAYYTKVFIGEVRHQTAALLSLEQWIATTSDRSCWKQSLNRLDEAWMPELVHVNYVEGRTLCNKRTTSDMQVVLGFEAYPGHPKIPAREATPIELRCPRCAAAFAPSGRAYKPRFVHSVMPLWRMLEHEEISRAEFDQKYETLIDDLISEMREAAAVTARPAASDTFPVTALRKPSP